MPSSESNRLIVKKILKNEFSESFFSFCNSFSIDSCFHLFPVTLLSMLNTLISKSVFVIKFACVILY